MIRTYNAPAYRFQIRIMRETAVCGWDIGGAHLKRVCLDAAGRVTDARQIVCPLWRGVEHLRGAMPAAWDGGGDTLHAVSMTGELCDNFESRADGVSAILAVVADVLGDRRTRIYAGPRGWCSVEQAMALGPEWIASANWRATADLVALTYDDVVLVDIGSTTTDLIPIVAATPAARGTDDATRLLHDELVYTGVVRTPLAAICRSVPFDGRWQRIAAEHFATTADVYRMLGELPEGADLHDTADGAGKTVAASARRIARMLGRDLGDDSAAFRAVSRYFAYRQFDTLQGALMGVLSRFTPACETIVAAGVGGFLVEKLARFNDLRSIDVVSLFDVVDGQRLSLSACAPAAALALLAWRDR
jgi:(4-(4-[2-(gamma-L-glutamylamino)ethyl]phenoxymethyl)furan-2-yl)methanamine synthase